MCAREDGLKMKNVFLASLAAVLIAGCSSEGPAKEAVKRLLNDPESARFSEMRPGKKQGDMCGLVNARNRMGGYVGGSPFFFEKATGATGIVTAPLDSDFRSLWLAVKTRSVGDDLGTLIERCKLMNRWGEICTDPHPQSKHAMCDYMQGDGKVLYEKLQWEYDR